MLRVEIKIKRNDGTVIFHIETYAEDSRSDKSASANTPRPANKTDKQRFLDLCSAYWDRMATLKREFLEQFMILDLRNYASSRLVEPAITRESTEPQPTVWSQTIEKARERF